MAGQAVATVATVAPLTACLAAASEAASWAVGLAGAGADPLRLELPPSDVGDDDLDPTAAAALAGLYLASEVEQAGAVPVAEALVEQRFALDLRDPAGAEALERFARSARRWLPAADRSRLFARLFGSPAGTAAGSDAGALANDQFEELLAGYCSAVVAMADDRRPPARSAAALRLAGDRLRRNLAPRQYGNTMLAAGAVVDQLRAALDLLALPAVGALFGRRGVWAVVGAAFGPDGPDIGRHVGRGRHGQVVVTSAGHPPVPDAVDAALVSAASGWLVATGFDPWEQGAGPASTPRRWA